MTKQTGHAACGRKPRIVVIGHLAGPLLFGAERSLLDILAAVDRHKYDLSCVLPARHEDYVRAIARHTDDIVIFPYRWWNGAPQGDPDAVARFEDSFRRCHADLVHVNTVTLMDPLIAASNIGIPSICHARELIYHNPELVRALGATAAGTVQMLRATAGSIIGNSEAARQLYYKRGRSFRLYGCVDIDAFDMTNEIERGRLKIGIISGNTASKGIEYFVRMAIMAAQRRLDLEFIVIGPHTEHTEALARLAQGAELPVHIRFAGYVAEPIEAVRQINVLASFSIVPESFGRTLVEAMAARRPVISFDGGAAPEFVRHGKDGFIVPYLAVGRALDHLEMLAGNPDCVAEMGRNAHARAADLFSPTSFAAGLNEIYQSILATPPAPAPSAQSDSPVPSIRTPRR